MKKPVELTSLECYIKHYEFVKSDLHELFQDCSKGNEQKTKAFADHWLQVCYQPIISETKDEYIMILSTDVKNTFARKNIPFTLPSEDEMVKDFVVHWDQIWPKFLQSALHVLMKELKQKPKKLGSEEFQNMPAISFKNQE